MEGTQNHCSSCLWSPHKAQKNSQANHYWHLFLYQYALFKANCTDTKRASFVTSWSNWTTQIAHLTSVFKESFTWLYEALSIPSNGNSNIKFWNYK